MSLDASAFRALTFDCYGTIIDWDGGIRSALEAVPSLAGCDFDRLVPDRERVEAELLDGGFRLYGEILFDSLHRTAALHGRETSDDEARAFVESMGTWPPFPDSDQALRRLASRYRLAILSNVETAVLERSLSNFDVPFDALVTAEKVRSYKPARVHFDEGLAALDLEPAAILHVAGSLYHDIRPAQALGWNTVWINRRGDSIPADLDPETVFPSLAALADALVS